MMNPQNKLLKRLDEIGRSLESAGTALALIGLGSVGRETERIDAYSDLDFFVIVPPRHKAEYMTDLSWLSRPAPIAYAFQNTPDGFKVLYEDGIFCECAVFEPQELASIPFAPGRLVWAAKDVDPSIAMPRRPMPKAHEHSVEWIVGEALTNLYVGLGRYRRGEKLSALRLVQGFAVDRLLELVAALEPQPAGLRDPFSPERRFEQRYPHLVEALAACMQGYEGTPQSAQAVLRFLEARVSVNATIKARIEALIQG